jgi:hypothetical protein
MFIKLISMLMIVFISGSAYATNCNTIFPTALSQTISSTITFTCGSRVLVNPSNVLTCNAVSNPGGCGTNTCPTGNCTASGTLAATLTPGAFQPSSVGSPNLTIANGNTGTAGSGGGVNYTTISGGNSSTLNFTSQGASTVYKIATLNISKNSTVNFVAGTYWINTLTLGTSVIFNVLGTGTVKLYINTATTTGSGLTINVGSGVTNPAQQIFIFTYSNLTLVNTHIVGFVYVT